MTWTAYDTYNGQAKWTTPTYNTTDWGFYHDSNGNNDNGWAYGKMYIGSYDGYVKFYDIKNGNFLYSYYVGNAGLDTPYGTWPLSYGGISVADHKVYACTMEHSPSMPIWMGEKMHCIDYDTGEGIWKLQGLWANPIIADGYLMACNGYDNQIYCIGKGLSATTVEASPKMVNNGTSVVIEGTVTDQSPGDTCLGIPAAGTPAIADKDMERWMEYLYMQQPMPTNATGVDVLLYAIRPDGSSIELGTATTDIQGHYSMIWTPPDTDCLYKIVAVFDGTESYWDSSAQTAVGVQPGPVATTTTVEAPVNPDYTPLFAGIGILAAVAVVVGVVNLYLIRKRK